MSDPNIETLLVHLKDENPQIREDATQSLWNHWFWQKGLSGVEKLKQSQILMDDEKFDEADALLSDLIQDHPDFAEAWNRRAVLNYMTANFNQAIHDCQATLTLVPFHFGALHGLGLCHAAQGSFSAAIQAFQQAIEIQPHALINKKLLLECMAQL